MIKTLVIGFGNTLRGDDGAGQVAAIRLAEKYPQVDCLNRTELTPELAEAMSSYDRVVFIDASVGTETLQWSMLTPRIEKTRIHSHTFAPLDLLHLAIEIFDQAPRQVELIEIPASQFGFCDRISSRTNDVVEQVIALFGETLDLHDLVDFDVWIKESATARQSYPQPSAGYSVS